MIIVWGFKTSLRFLGIVTLTCANCHNPAAHRLEETVRTFTLFWLPLFAVKRRTAITCTFCGLSGLVPPDQVDGLLAHAQQPVGPGRSPYPSQPRY